MKEVPACCGAGYESSKTLDVSAVGQHRYGFVLTDGPVEGFTKICDQLYYIALNGSWQPPERRTDGTEWTSKPKHLTHPEEYYIFGEKLEETGVSILCSFPYFARDLTSNFLKCINFIKNQDVIAILNDRQSRSFEWFLLDFGFNVVSRTINPKHDSKITLYHRPKELKVEQQST